MNVSNAGRTSYVFNFHEGEGHRKWGDTETFQEFLAVLLSKLILSIFISLVIQSFKQSNSLFFPFLQTSSHLLTQALYGLKYLTLILHLFLETLCFYFFQLNFLDHLQFCFYFLFFLSSLPNTPFSSPTNTPKSCHQSPVSTVLPIQWIHHRSLFLTKYTLVAFERAAHPMLKIFLSLCLWHQFYPDSTPNSLTPLPL